ncbi:hypothetical protein BKA70DRAFT_1264631 [Coprinopsis sp. MPI-PUGE-AT-0042]|nr:hypothetical protein BKA70DRAFT_1264631 [Coprinopsis sp. MPI-PUGE-AT-0042]
MPLSAIIDDSALFANVPPDVFAIVEDPKGNYYNGTSRMLYAGLRASFTLHALGVLVYGPQRKGSFKVELIGENSANNNPPAKRANEFWQANAFGGWWGNVQTDGRGDKIDVLYTCLTWETEIDFVLYDPSPSWSAAGITLLLDDQDDLATYSGSWNHTRDDFSLPTTFPTGNALQLTISQTREPGATFKASFVGSNPQVYGALQQVAGNVTVAYTIDGNFTETVTLSPTLEGVNTTNWELNRRLFGHSNDSFYADEKAEHTLEVTVKEVTGDQMFSFDYLTFEGTPWTNVTSARSLPAPFGQSNSSKRKLAIGLGVSLPLALIIAVGLFFFFRRKKGKRAP